MFRRIATYLLALSILVMAVSLALRPATATEIPPPTPSPSATWTNPGPTPSGLIGPTGRPMPHATATVTRRPWNDPASRVPEGCAR